MTPGSAVFYSSALPADSGGSRLVAGLRAALDEAGVPLVAPLPPAATDDAAAERAGLLASAADPRVGAAVVMYRGGRANLAALRDLVATGKPVVLVNRDVAEVADDADGPSCDFVGVNDFDSARRVVAHLVARGHRSIAHVTSGDPSSPVAERLRGYRRALEAAGLAFRPELVVPHDTDEGGELEVSPALLRRLRALPDPPTALFAVHDWAALNALLTAHLCGLRVPGDLAVAGFDGIGEFREGAPLLTSAEQPFEEVGRHAGLLAADRLREVAAGRRVRARRCVYLEAPLRVHESSAAARGDSGAGADAAGRLLAQEGAWRARLVHRYLSLRLAEPLTLEDLATVAGVSARRLLEDFQRHERSSPMRALAELRLARVRAELLREGAPATAPPAATVSAVATRWGVTQLGRFSGLYRRRYGEAPSDTLRRARCAAAAAAALDVAGRA